MSKLPATTTANVPQQPVKQRSRWFQEILPLKRSNIGNDIIAGIVLAAIGISLAVLITIQLFERFIPKFPGALLAVVVAIVASWQFNLASRGVTVVGAVPSS